MDATSVEKSLVQYHLLHFAIGAVLAAILLAVPKLIGVVLTSFLAALVLPSIVLSDFTGNKWLDRAAVIAGAIIVGVVFYFLKKL